MNKENEGCVWALAIWGTGFVAVYFNVLELIMLAVGCLFLGVLFKNSPVSTVVLWVSVFISVKLPIVEFIFKPIAFIAIVIIFFPVFSIYSSGGGSDSGSPDDN